MPVFSSETGLPAWLPVNGSAFEAADEEEEESAFGYKLPAVFRFADGEALSEEAERR